MAKKATIMTVLGWDDSAFVKGARAASVTISALSKAAAKVGKGVGAVGAGGIGAASVLGSMAAAPVRAMAWVNQAMEGLTRVSSPLMKVATLVNDSIWKAASMETTLLSYEVMLGSASRASKLFEELVQFEAKTPMTLTEITDATKMLIAYQLPAENMVETLRDVGDVASALAVPLTEMAVLYGKARVENRLYTRDVMEFQNRGIPMWEELGKYYKKSVRNIKEMVETGSIGFTAVEKVFQNITGKGGAFFDMMARRSKTFEGLFSTLKSQVESLQRAFATPIIQELKPIMVEFTAWMETQTEAVTKFGADIGGAIAPLVGMFKEKTLLEFFGRKLKLIILEAANVLVAAAGVAAAKLDEAMNFKSWKKQDLRDAVDARKAELDVAVGGSGVAEGNLKKSFDFSYTPFGVAIIGKQQELAELVKAGARRQELDTMWQEVSTGRTQEHRDPRGQQFAPEETPLRTRLSHMGSVLMSKIEDVWKTNTWATIKQDRTQSSEELLTQAAGVQKILQHPEAGKIGSQHYVAQREREEHTSYLKALIEEVKKIGNPFLTLNE